MKTRIRSVSHRLACFGLLSLILSLFAATSARAGLAVYLEAAHAVNNYTPAFPDTNYQILLYDVESTTNLPAAPFGNYVISSPTGLYSETFDLGSGGISNITGGNSIEFPNYNSFIQELTNGNWTIVVSNGPSSNVFSFKLSAPGLTSNTMPDIHITYPAIGAVNVTNNPVFTWQPLTSWGSGGVQAEDSASPSFFQEGFLSTTASNWTSPVTLPNGLNEFLVAYSTPLGSVIAATTPTNGAAQAISAWTFQAFLDDYALESFTVTNTTPPPSTNLTIVGHYTYDTGSQEGIDSSGNNNDLFYPFPYNSGSVNITSDAVEGGSALQFFNNGGTGGAYYYSSNTNLLSTLAGSFSLSLWVKTTQTSGNNTDSGTYTNVGIASTFTESLVPMALTGSKLAFYTVKGTQDTLHSVTSINTGQYVHVVVTRDSTSGAKKIYVNGALDASSTGPSGLITNLTEWDIGSQNGKGLNGEIDDIQLYSGVLSTAQVTQLHNSPGTTVGTAPPTPVSASINIQVSLYRDLADGFSDYSLNPQITFADPAPITTNRLESPDGQAFSEVFAGDTFQDDQNSEGFNSLSDLIAAGTGQWKLYVNKGDPSQRIFTFNVSFTGLTTNLLAAVDFLAPTNLATNVSPSSPIRWTGPTNFSSTFVEAYYQYPSFGFDGYTTLPGTATNWPSSPALFNGTNYLYISCTSNSYPGVTFSQPVDGSLNPISSFSTEVDLASQTFISFVVAGATPVPVQISAAPSQSSGGTNFQFGFQTVAGRMETIQMRTNLLSGSWTNVTNFIGDGSSQQFNFSLTNSPGKYFRVITQ